MAQHVWLTLAVLVSSCCVSSVHSWRTAQNVSSSRTLLQQDASTPCVLGSSCDGQFDIGGVLNFYNFSLPVQQITCLQPSDLALCLNDYIRAPNCQCTSICKSVFLNHTAECFVTVYNNFFCQLPRYPNCAQLPSQAFAATIYKCATPEQLPSLEPYIGSCPAQPQVPMSAVAAAPAQGTQARSSTAGAAAPSGSGGSTDREHQSWAAAHIGAVIAIIVAAAVCAGLIAAIAVYVYMRRSRSKAHTIADKPPSNADAHADVVANIARLRPSSNSKDVSQMQTYGASSLQSLQALASSPTGIGGGSGVLAAVLHSASNSDGFRPPPSLGQSSLHSDRMHTHRQSMQSSVVSTVFMSMLHSQQQQQQRAVPHLDAQASAQTDNQPPDVVHSQGLSKLLERSRQQLVTKAVPYRKDIDFNVDPNTVRIGQMLGTGSYAVVYEGWWLTEFGGQKHVAVKVLLPVVTKDARIRRMFREEMEIMARIDHPNIVRCYGGCMRDDCCMLLLEFMEGGPLDHYIHKTRKGGLKEDEVLWVAHQIGAALAYLHPSVVHADVKPQNILLDGRGDVKLADFGLSKVKYSEQLQSKLGCTPPYTAPEVFDGERCSEKVDVYSLGMVMWEALCGEWPWKELVHTADVYHKVKVMNERPVIPSSCSEALRQLIESCWNADPRLRPSAHEIARLALLHGERLASASS